MTLSRTVGSRIRAPMKHEETAAACRQQLEYFAHKRACHIVQQNDEQVLNNKRLQHRNWNPKEDRMLPSRVSY